MRSAGRELTFAPLEEIADMTLDGIANDKFWIYAESGQSSAQFARRLDHEPDPTRLHAPSRAVHPSELTDRD